MIRIAIASAWIGLFLVQAARAQETMSELVAALGSSDWALREAASREAVARSLEWTEADVALLAAAEAGEDAELARLARIAHGRILVRRRLAGPLLEMGLDAAIRYDDPETLRAALERAADDWWIGRVRDADLEGLVDLAIEAGGDLPGPCPTFVPGDDTESPPRHRCRFPPSYGRLLVDRLRAGDPADRKAAREVLFRAEPGPWVETLAPTLVDLPFDAREAAVNVLVWHAGSETEGIGRALDRFLESSGPELARSRLYRYTRTGAAGLAAEIVGALRSTDLFLRFSAGDALDVLGAREAVPHLVPLLEDPRSEVRIAALEALARVGAREETRRFETLRRDADPKVRAAAALAILRSGGDLSPDEIASAASSRPQDVLGELCARRGPEAAAGIVSLLLLDAPIPEQARDRLIFRGDRDSLDASIAALPSAGGDVLGYLAGAIRSLAADNLTAREQAGTMARLLAAQDPRIRCVAAVFFGDHGWDDPGLEALLSDRNEQVRRHAARALARAGGRARALALLAGGDSAVQRGACAAILEEREFDLIDRAFPWSDRITIWGHPFPSPMRDGAALSAHGRTVASLLGHPDPEVRRWAAQALGWMGGLESAAGLVAALRDPDAGVRADVAVSLARLRAPAARQELVRCLSDPEAAVVLGALDALAALGEAEAIAGALARPDFPARTEAAEPSREHNGGKEENEWKTRRPPQRAERLTHGPSQHNPSHRHRIRHVPDLVPHHSLSKIAHPQCPVLFHLRPDPSLPQLHRIPNIGSSVLAEAVRKDMAFGYS